MTNTISSTATAEKRKAKFTPKMENFRTSLMYEGLTLKNNQSIAALKRKYAR
jgi:hypothetical protein